MVAFTSDLIPRDLARVKSFSVQFYIFKVNSSTSITDQKAVQSRVV